MVAPCNLLPLNHLSQFNMKKLFFFLLLMTVLSNSCKKDEPPYVPAFTNTISAKIDGVDWKNIGCFSCIAGGSGIDKGFTNNILSISGQQGQIFVEFRIGKITGPGTYAFKSNGTNSGNGDFINTDVKGPNGESPYYYDTNDTLQGSVTITNYDPSNKIIEGTFQFDAANRYYPTLIKHITEGKFSVKYN